MPNFDLTPVVESVSMRRVKTLVDSVLSKKMPVLLYGEAGAGKTFWAKFIHSNGAFSPLPFVKISCKNLDADEFLQALAFKGTLYLQDFADIDEECQDALLRTLESGSFGFRLIVSSRRNLEECVGEKVSRRLYNSLSLMPISIPPLRERREDALPLAEFFLRHYSECLQKDFFGFSDEAKSEICGTFWQENVRELKNCVKTAAKTQKSPLILTVGAKKMQFSPLKQAVNEFKKEYVRKVFQSAGRKSGETAKILHLQRTYLSKLMKDFEIK